MKKRRHWKEQLVTALELPGDLAYRDAIVTVTVQNQAVVENYRCILRYSPEEIVLRTLCGKVTISGKCLEIPCYTPLEMMIKGRICRVVLENI